MNILVDTVKIERTIVGYPGSENPIQILQVEGDVPE